MPYVLALNHSGRDLPAKVDSDRVMRVARPSWSIDFTEDGDVATLFDSHGRIVAVYEYRAPCFSTEAYLNN
jgi:hypothetical protein